MDPILLNNFYFGAGQTCYRMNITDADAELASLPVGGYFVYLDSSDTKGATLRLGAAAAAPTDGGGAAAGSVIPPGVPMTLLVREVAGLHGIMNFATATGTLYITKVR